MITFDLRDDNSYKVYYSNGIDMGELEKGMDGYFVYWQNKRREGYWNSYILRTIADKLDEINKNWGDKTQEYFNNSEDK